MDRSADNIGQVINDIQRDLEELKTTQLRVRENIYPVGSIYMSTTISTVTGVEEAFGGTWESWGMGRTIVGVDPEDADFDTVEETGGEKTHTLTVAEMPKHTHPVYAVSTESTGTQKEGLRSTGRWYGNSSGAPNVANTGGDGAHNNLQPYITCYIYRRIA